MLPLLQAARALGIVLDDSEEEDEECVPTVKAADIPTSGPQIQNGLNYFRYGPRSLVCTLPQVHVGFNALISLFDSNAYAALAQASLDIIAQRRRLSLFSYAKILQLLGMPCFGC